MGQRLTVSRIRAGQQPRARRALKARAARGQVLLQPLLPPAQLQPHPPAKATRFDPFPRPTAIAMQFQRGEGKPPLGDPRSKHRLKARLQRARFVLGHLVLNGDVQARLVEILHRQAAVEMFSNQRPQRQQLRRSKRDGGALAQIHHSGNCALWCDKLCGHLGQKIAQFIQQRRRKGVKQGDVRVEVISLDREMRASETFGPRAKVGRQRRGEDERVSQLQPYISPR